ncbi:MAG: tyrosine-type recombinase/integrase [Candidatus Hydrothermarchaeales archaeon]
MADKDSKMLMEGILDYMRWIKSVEDLRGSGSSLRYTQILTDFLLYVIHKGITWKQMFTLETLEAFRTYSSYKGACRALMALSGYLFSQGRIEQPLQPSKPQPPLPDIYEQYLLYHAQSQQPSPRYLRQTRRVLSLLHQYLQKHNIKLPALKIDHLDGFMATFKVSQNSGRIYRYRLRGFLKYLYHERKVTKRDLAPLLVGPPQFAQRKLPKFLRPKQVNKLFDSLKLSTPTEKRTYAMVHLAYSLGLRPVEIGRINLDDVSFQKAELALKERKGGNPITLPIPENTIKAIALYLSKGRPQSPSRELFLTHHFPHHPVSSNTVVGYISKAMKKAGLPSSAYWLRHTYAQNLLQIGQSIYEVKEMMGHQNIQSTHRYLHINTALMRKVLFDEELP